MAGIKIDWTYHVTTIDPPEVVKFIKRHHEDVRRERPDQNMFTRIATKGLPTRLMRWCCEEYKEVKSPPGARIVVGIRWAESPRRREQWKVLTFHARSRQTALAPIIDWTDDDVWEFIHARGLQYPSLYDEGFKRLGCIACPMGGRTAQLREFARWPHYEKMWKRAAKAAFEHKIKISKPFRRGDTWEDYWLWWMRDPQWEAAHPKESQEAGGPCQGMLDFYS